MDNKRFSGFNFRGITTPALILDEEMLIHNGEILQSVRKRTGCKILLAVKAYAVHTTFKLLGKYLDGICASGIHEARLGQEFFCKEVHTFSPAYTNKYFNDVVKYSDTIIFNSPTQYCSFIDKTSKSNKIGLRVNPGYSEVENDLYNPCIQYSRLGMNRKQFDTINCSRISGIHFHALCEQGADTLKRVVFSFEKLYGDILSQMQWVNFGGGHNITKDGYDIDLLCNLIIDFKKRYNVDVILEPGEAVAYNAGILVAKVVDIVHNEIKIAILDTSAETHMPDVLAMPYRPDIISAGEANQKLYTYKLAGNTCLAGDIIGDYSFDKPLKVGDLLQFCDMAIYSTVKNTTFNGVQLPSIWIKYINKTSPELIKSFGYNEFMHRNG